MTYDHRVAGAYEPLWRRIEAAIEAHPVWTMANPDSDLFPLFEICRSGCVAKVLVRKHGKGKAHELFGGKQSTPEAATDSLIEALDYWASR